MARNSFAMDCEKHPIYCHIKSLRPKMDSKKAMKLSNMLHVYSRKYKTKNAILSVAIAMQETSLRSDLSRRQNVIIFNEEMTEWEVVKGYSDICMFQFHVGTIVREKLDPIKLITNLEYCTEQHFKLLKKKMRICKHLKDDSWTCYHSKTPRRRKRYKEDVERYL